MATSSITPFPYVIDSITNVTPLTYRDAATYLEKLEDISNWLNNVLIPDTDKVLAEAVAGAQAGIANAEATVIEAKDGWTELFTEFMANVAAEIGTINNAVIDGRITAGITGKLDKTEAATTYETKTDADAALELADDTYETKTNAAATFATKTGVTADIGAAVAELKRDPLKFWKDAVQNQKTVPAVYVNLGDSIANGGNPQRSAFAWLSRVTALYTNRIFDRLDAATMPPVQPNGVQVYNGAVGGKTSANYLTDALVQRIGVIKPQLISHMVKANDQTAGITPTQYKANIKTWVEKIQVVSPASVHILINQHNRHDLVNPTYSGDEYAAQLETLATELGSKVVYLDIGREFKNHGMPNTNRYGLFDTDELHFDNSGNRVYADIIGRFIGAPRPDYIPREIHSAPNFANGAVLNSSSSAIFATLKVKPKPYIRQGLATFDIYGAVNGTIDANIVAVPVGGANELVHATRLKNGTVSNHQGTTNITFEPNTEYEVRLTLGIYNADTFNPTGSLPVYYKFFTDISPA